MSQTPKNVYIYLFTFRENNSTLCLCRSKQSLFCVLVLMLKISSFNSYYSYFYVRIDRLILIQHHNWRDQYIYISHNLRALH